MNSANFELPKYLNRICMHSAAGADIASITEMMRCQLFSVPFENLDVQAGKAVSLVAEDIVDKLVHHHRGGYCFEVNGLFAMALGALGVEYQFVAARPLLFAHLRPKTHMALVVNLQGEKWLCDLGFGSYGIRAPMRLDALDVALQQDGEVFQLGKLKPHEYVVQALVDGKWQSQYSFDLSPQEWVDFEPANYFSYANPESIFVKKLLVVLHTPDGRKILFGDAFKTVAQGETVRQLLKPQDRPRILRDEFGLQLDAV
jgi:N-hydroxyarylamine O-acetyltransferase